MKQNLGGSTDRQKTHKWGGYQSPQLQQYAHPTSIAGGRSHSPSQAHLQNILPMDRCEKGEKIRGGVNWSEQQ